MTEVMEPTEAQQKAINEFKMPKPARGQQILHYPHADKSEQPEVVFARKVGHRAITIFNSGYCIDTVPHIDDPRLVLNDDQRSAGAWDFAENDRTLADLKDRVATLESKVALLESFLNEPSKKEKAK